VWLSASPIRSRSHSPATSLANLHQPICAIRGELRIAIDWGRYGELFDFDANTGQFTLETRHFHRAAERPG
jgi:hypothetical protein